MKKYPSHRKLAAFVALAGISILGVWHGAVEENMLALVPKPIKQQVSLFERSALSQKLIVITQAPTATQARKIAQDVHEKLLQAGFIRPENHPTETIISQFLQALPSLFSADAQKKVLEKISPAYISQQFSQYREELFSFQSLFIKQLIVQDPFYFTGIIFDAWKNMGQEAHADYAAGFLTAQEGTLLAGLYDATSGLSNLSAAQQMQQFFEHYQATLPAGARVFFMGGLRYTLENAAVIKHDLLVITGVGLICLLGVFGWFFRTKRALLIYLLPLLVLPPAAWVTQGVFGHISGITLGFGSVVVGLSVDYAIYIYFALQQTRLSTASTLAHIRKHLWCNFVTSGLCFAALLFSSIEVFKQMAVFSLVALALALTIALWALPDYFSQPTKARPSLSKWKIKPLSFRAACGVSIVILAAGLWGVCHLTVSPGLDSLNSTSATFTQEQQIAKPLFGADQQALLFALGSTPDQALANNEKLSARLPVPLPVSQLFPSKRTQATNWQRWQTCWDAPRLNYAKLLLQEEAAKQGFNSVAFTPFWQWLAQSKEQAFSTDFSGWYNPVVKLSPKQYAVMNIVPNEPAYADAADGKDTFFVSTLRLQQDLSDGVKQEAVWVVIMALVFNFGAVWLLFRRVKETLFCFIPVLLGGCILFGCLALFHISVNLFGLIFLPLLVGLGIDYAIFQCMKGRARQQQLDWLYPPQALLAAGLSTLAGFGVLVFAKHAVLFMMGLCALVGIGGAVCVALLILPALWEKFA